MTIMMNTNRETHIQIAPTTKMLTRYVPFSLQFFATTIKPLLIYRGFDIDKVSAAGLICLLPIYHLTASSKHHQNHCQMFRHRMKNVGLAMNRK